MRKVRISKKPSRAALQRYQLKAGGEYKRAIARQFGSQGAAGPVRHIDPADYNATVVNRS
jgi:hypothetical protein